MQSRNLQRNLFVLAVILGILASVLVAVLSGQQVNAEGMNTEAMEYDETINMWITGANQGDFNGGSMRAGREGTIDVLGFSHSVVMPIDAATGYPTGKRVHSPLTIVKEIDQATPLLFQALVTNENLVDVTIRWYRIDPASGGEEQYYTIELQNAAVASIMEYSGGDHALMETVSFTYQKIIWTWVDGGITSTDDWESPTV
ncbi:MAG: type VI secretion system tube protein Hcp [Candidatus Heimdallarchaeota archaeon]|nr:MAG: type VI secretion system tube protein Hcp [Candidatus Heimdallarchaeota archaeon]